MSLTIRKLQNLKVEVLAAGQVHHFPTLWVTKGQIEGWLEVKRGKITIMAENGDHVYDLVRYPGAYCDSCGQRLADGPALTYAESLRRKEHSQHCDTPPSEKNPSGYSVINYYDGRLMKVKT